MHVHEIKETDLNCPLVRRTFQIPKYEECGCCGMIHRAGYDGDCRNDEERFSLEQLDDRHGPLGWVLAD